MGLAAVMAVSAMSMSAFAKEDALIATVPTENGEIVEVYKSDVENGGYIVDCGSYIVTIDDNIVSASLNNGLSIQSVSTGVFKTGWPTVAKAVRGTTNWNLTFSNAKGKTKYTPYQYTPASGYSSITYHFTSDEDYGSKVYATVDCVNNSAYSPVTLYFADGDEHSISISGMTPGNCCYAYVTNSTYSGTATGTCVVSN